MLKEIGSTQAMLVVILKTLDIDNLNNDNNNNNKNKWKKKLVNYVIAYKDTCLGKFFKIIFLLVDFIKLNFFNVQCRKWESYF